MNTNAGRIFRSLAQGTLGVALLLGFSTQAQGELKPVNLIFAYTGNGAPRDLKAVQDAMNAILVKKINATVELRPYDWGSYDQKLNLAFAAGQGCDLAFMASWLGYNTKAAAGNFYPMDELLPKYAPKLYGRFPKAVWAAAKVDGKIYGSIVGGITAQTYGIHARKDLADKYGLNLGTVRRYEDLSPYFARLKKGDPDVTPLSASRLPPEYLGYDPLELTLGLVVKYNDKSLKVKSVWETPEFLRFAKLMRAWYQAGYMPKTPGLESDQVAGLKAGKYAAFMKWQWSPARPLIWKDSTQIEVVGKSFTKPIITTGVATGNLTSICRSSKDPERAMMMIEAIQNTPELYMLLAKGLEGKHWVWKDKERRVIGYPEGVSAQSSGYAPDTDWMFGDPNMFYFQSPEAIPVRKQELAYQKTAVPSVALGFAFNPSPVKSEVAQLTSIAKEFGDPIIYGQVDPVQGIAELVKRYKAAGGDKVIAEAQAQIDAWASKR